LTSADLMETTLQLRGSPL